MLAFAWHRGGNASECDAVAKRLGDSLCAGIGGRAAIARIDRFSFAYRPLLVSSVSPAWRPTTLASGRLVAFHGYFDNADDIAEELGVSSSHDHQKLYGAAVEQWGDQADRKIVGEYCSVIVEPASTLIRLARSPLRAPPLQYFHGDDLTAAASVPRALFAAGVERRLNEERVADSAMINFTDCEASWFEDVRRVPVGCIVELSPRHPARLTRYYDALAYPKVRMKSDAEYLARASQLLDDGVQACLKGFRAPGSTLSGGLDSPQVAVRALAMLHEGQRLPTFTFHPEDEFDAIVEPGALGDERPFVEAFAAMHPGIEPHFTANEGYEHDYRWKDFFHLMGGAPTGLTNMYVFHGLLAGAAKRGCDVLLLAEWGNYTFSDKGDWGYVEYFLTGRWRQWWRALKRVPHVRGTVWRQIIARTASALLPEFLWRPLRRIALPENQFLLELMQPLSKEYRQSSGADQRLKQSGILFERYQPWNARHAKRLLFQNDDAEGAEIYQAFEQMYGVAMRDPMAYRPFVEYCFGRPVGLFMRDGEMRWLAKQMARDIMPEEQRQNRLNGRWDSDWHLRMTRRRSDFIAEVDRLADDPRLAAMIDIPRLRQALEDWPDQTPTDPQVYFAQEFAVPRALLTARFINYVEGRNQT